MNIALVNELSIIFDKLNKNTKDVLDAANTKWNFQKFIPGLVGGHCIGVDPYYLIFKAKRMNYYPEVVLAGRKINDEMGKYITEKLVLNLIKRGIFNKSIKLLVLGFSFKEDCNDIRNTGVLMIIESIKNYQIDTEIVDPLVNKEEALKMYNLKIKNKINTKNTYDAIILAVAHKEFKKFDLDFFERILSKDGLIFDIKSILPESFNVLNLILYYLRSSKGFTIKG